MMANGLLTCTQPGNTQDDNKKEAMANMTKGFKAKEISERGLRIVEGKDHMSLKCYQIKCQLLIEEGSPDSVFVLWFVQYNGILYPVLKLLRVFYLVR